MSPVRRRAFVLAASSLALVSAVGQSAGGGRDGVSVRTRSLASPTSAARSRVSVDRAHSAAKHDHHSGGQGLGAGSARPSLPVSLQAPASIPLTGAWQYLPDPHNVGLRSGWAQGAGTRLAWTPVTIPNDFNPIVSNTTFTGTVGWYKLWFTGPQAFDGRSWNVYFEEVRRSAQVWLNGEKIGSSSDPYAPFSVPAKTLEPGRPNLLVVRVDNFKGPGSFPEDWWNWGGIVRPVTLQPVGRLRLEDLGVMPELGCGYRCGDLLVQGTLHNTSKVPLRPRIVLTGSSPTGTRFAGAHSTRSIRPGASAAISFRVHVPTPLDLWSPSSPSLYKVQVQAVGGRRVEQVDSLQVGLRSVQVRGAVLYLNGQRLWLHGAAIHEDMPWHGAAMSDSDIATIVSELQSVGANITRVHYLLDERLLNALDAAGIMVWSQPPVDHADPVLRTASGRARALATLRATIVGDRNHASVIVDSLGNELSPTPDAAPGTRSYLNQAIALARRLDPVAPVGLDIYGYPGYPAQRLYSRFDVLGISDYFGWYAGPSGHSIADLNGLQPFLLQTHARYPNQALAIAEFGAEGRFDGPVSTKGTYEFQSNYVQQTFSVIDQLPFLNGAIYWTLREFAVNPGWTGGAILPAGDPPDGLHHKGLIAYDGTDKPAFAVAQQLFATQPGFVPAAAARNTRSAHPPASVSWSSLP
jgi:beta-glucuronidase